MLSKNKIKYIRSLELKKFRSLNGAFVAEGNKLVESLMGVFECEWMLAKPSWMATRGDIASDELLADEDDEIRKVSFLSTPQDVIAVFRLPSYGMEEVDASVSLVLALDGVQDPGNLGAIVRIAAWFGIGHVICSADCADVFSPKAVQATMGAVGSVKVHYTSLTDYLSAQSRSTPVYGAFMDGDNLYKSDLTPSGIIIMGNEGNGIREDVGRFARRRLLIPSSAPSVTSPDSLNVATATAIVCAEFRRRFA
ncbi:MAG: RNA methyltransferase [Tannerellaceae bacterium]|jgi:TrmH family RNA methyltransferase|nr:RNA methyltransferase [Tannerellaceae bacterium]